MIHILHIYRYLYKSIKSIYIYTFVKGRWVKIEKKDKD